MISGEKSTVSCAFRGEAPEAWRALGQFDPAGGVESADASSPFVMNPFVMDPKFTALTDFLGNRTVDFDGDGVTDALVGGMAVPRVDVDITTGSRTVMVRSGRDGRVVWKTGIGPLGSWVDPSIGDGYALSAFPLPEGDLDGDGTPDVIVEKRPGSAHLRGGVLPDLELEVLSGRTGGRLFTAPFSSGVPILTGARRERLIEPVVIEPNGKPDLIIRCDENNRPKMARISGRNGRLVRDAPLVDDATHFLQIGAPILFDDVNGDGVLDALFVKTQTSSSDSTECVLRVISLRDGKQIWSQPVGLIGDHQGFGDFCAGDLDGDAGLRLWSSRRRTTWGEGTRRCKFAPLTGAMERLGGRGGPGCQRIRSWAGPPSLWWISMATERVRSAWVSALAANAIPRAGSLCSKAMGRSGCAAA